MKELVRKGKVLIRNALPRRRTQQVRLSARKKRGGVKKIITSRLREQLTDREPGVGTSNRREERAAPARFLPRGRNRGIAGKTGTLCRKNWE